MDIDAAIAKLGTKLDEWFDGNLTTFASQDHRTQGKALDRGIAIVRELDRLKAEGLAALAALLEAEGCSHQRRTHRIPHPGIRIWRKTCRHSS